MKPNATLFIFADVGAVMFLGISNSESAESALDKEAINAAQAKLGERATQCGDDAVGYPATYPNGLHQYKNLRYTLESRPLSTADKLMASNGQEELCMCLRLRDTT